MKIIKLLALLLTLPTLSVNGQSVLKGSLKGHDDQPMRMAHIYLNKKRSDLNNTIATVKADGQGRFELLLPANELLMVTFTGANHKPIGVPVLVDNRKKTIELEVRLSSSQLSPGGMEGSVSFSDPVYQQSYDILTRLNLRIPTIIGKHMGLKTKKERDGFVHDARQELLELERRIESETDPMVRSVLYKSYLGIQALRNTYNDSDERVVGRPKKAIALEVLEEISPSSPLWDTSMLKSLFTILNEDFVKHESAYFKIIDQAEGSIKSWMLMQLGLFSHEHSFTETYLKCQNALQNEFPDSRALNQLTVRTAKKEVVVGNYIPDFEISNLDGGTITKKSLEGKVYLIDFWATWCGPCIVALPELAEIQKQYKRYNFEVLSISMDKDSQSPVNFRDQKQAMPWLNGWAKGGMRSAFSQAFEMTGIPLVLLIDENGKILAKSRSAKAPEVIAILDKLFASNE